jgi:hypothetical protein
VTGNADTATTATTATSASAVPASGITGATLASNVTASSLTSFGTDPTANTQAVDNNSTKIATTAFVLGQASASPPAMSGTAAVGTSTRYARADHVHGSDTSKASLATSNTFTTGTQIIATGADGTVGFRIKRNSATQSANLLEVTQSDGTTILAKIDSSGSIASAGLTLTGTSTLLLGSSGSTGGNIVFATTGGTQSLIAGTGATGSQTLPSTAGTLLNSATTSIPTVTTANGLTSATSLASVGTITSGTWNANAIDISKGGTNTIYGNNLVGSSVIVTDRAKAATEPTIEAAFWNAGATAANYFAVDKASLYYVEGVLNLGKVATTATINTQLQYIATGSTSSLTEQSCTFVSSTFTTTAGIGINTATAANTTISSTTTTGTVLVVRFNGVLKTNASTDGRINIGFSASASVSLTLRAGSFLRVHKIGADTTSNFGAWSA